MTRPQARPACAISVLAASWFAAHPSPAADPVCIGLHEDLEHGLGHGWAERTFPSVPRHNRIAIEREENGNHFLRIESQDSSSVEALETDIDARLCPVLAWRWRVDGPITTDDLHSRAGDDAAAKLYVVFQSASPWRIWEKRSLVYVWDSSLPVGAVVPNAWRPDEVRMVVRETGGARAGDWVTESANLPEHFARAFPGEEMGHIEGIALSADSDNTHGRASAGFDDLEVRCIEDTSARSSLPAGPSGPSS